MRCLSIVSFLGLASSQSDEELAMHTFEGHTPTTTQWEIVNLNAVSATHAKDPGVHIVGKTASFEACQAICAANVTCNAFDWAGGNNHGKKCPTKDLCYLRSDSIWDPVTSSACNHTAGRKVSPTPAPTPMPPPQPPLGYQPNIVFILTDDQDTRLGRDDYTDIGSLEIMPKLQKHLMQGGARMSNAFVATPICCPSRTEFFSGRYFHNVGPPNDPGSCMHADTTQAALKTTGVFGLMKSAGYEVGVFGKTTNDQTKILQLMSKEGSASWIDSRMCPFCAQSHQHSQPNSPPVTTNQRTHQRHQLTNQPNPPLTNTRPQTYPLHCSCRLQQLRRQDVLPRLRQR